MASVGDGETFLAQVESGSGGSVVDMRGKAFTKMKRFRQKQARRKRSRAATHPTALSRIRPKKNGGHWPPCRSL